MENKNSNGCLYGVIILGVFYLALFIFSSVMDTLESNLPGPIISVGIPVIIIIALVYINKNKDSENDN